MYVSFFNPRFRGKGYATQTVETLLTFGFEKLGLHRIFAWCDVENVAYARVLERTGKLLESRLREHATVRGKWRDAYIYAILQQ